MPFSRPRFAVALVVLLTGLAGPALADANLRVGTCRRDITPVSPALADAYAARFGAAAVVNHTDPVLLAGFDNGRAATGYHDRLWARGIVFDGRGGRVALVALDLIGYFVNEVDTIRAMVAPASGIDYLVVHSTHQHEGPDTLGLWGATATQSGIDFAYLDFVNAAVADCVDEAAANLRSAKLRYVTTDAVGLSLGVDPEDDGFGVGDGKVLAGDEQLAPATQGRIVDPRLAALQVTSVGKHPSVIATLVNFASHPESLGSDNTLITSDFPHFARARLEAQYGGLAIWVSGALGVLQGPLDIDVLDPATNAAAPRRTFRFAEVHGSQLATRAIRAFAADRSGKSKHASKAKGKGKAKGKSKGKPRPPIAFATTAPVALPLENPYFRFLGLLGVLNERRLPLYTDGQPDTSVGLTPEGLPGLLGEDLHTEVGAFRIGEGSFAVVPGELDPQIGERYRARMQGAAHTFIVGLGNDEIGYQMPAEKWDDSCHECAQYEVFGSEDDCPVQPVDCSTVFINNVGQQVDPTISGALLPLLDALH